MGVKVYVTCDLEVCDAQEEALDGRGLDAVDYGTYGKAPQAPTGWIDGMWIAPKGWSFDRAGYIRCPKHKEEENGG